jgi:SagB-type dehydrogenase family enzyme
VNEPEAALAFHRLTRHGSPVDRSALVDFRPLDPSNRPAPFKRYRGLETRPLPRSLEGWGIGTGVREFDGDELGRLLFLAAGVSRVSDSPVFEERTYFRTTMSAGNLHPVEVYVVAGGRMGDVAPGVHHYDPLGHGLTRLREEGSAGIAFVLTGIPWRTAWKYGERGWRHLYWDAGGIVANLLAVSEADGIHFHTRVLVGFDDDEVASLVGVDGTTEFPLAIVTIGTHEAPDPSVDDAPPLESEPISPRPVRFPLIETTQRAGVIDDVDTWRLSASGLGEPASPGVPAPSDLPPVEDVILQRGSTRIMRHGTAPLELLEWGMGSATRPVPGDFAGEGRTLLQHFLSVHDVEGVEPGAYRWRADTRSLEPVHLGDHRNEAELLCLRQPLGGDSAFTVFHCADLDAVLGALGARGYRAAQFEAGVAAGRLSLAAFALGFGATGLTFFDEAVSKFFATSASCMLVTSVGIPAYRNAPGGPPGAATELAGYGRLMERLSLQLHRSR